MIPQNTGTISRNSGQVHMDVQTSAQPIQAASATLNQETLARSYQFCQQVACREAGNFYWSFRLLPPDRRKTMCALYAFMRKTDDIADMPTPGQDRAKALDQWQIALNEHLAGQPEIEFPWEGFPALMDLMRNYRIPPRYLHAVIDGVRWDLNPIRIQTDAEFRNYCWHVASAVGLCCLHIWGFESDNGRAEKLAETLGLAFQRTNILRDIHEDFANNRIYLAQDWLNQYGVKMNDLALPTSTEPLKKLVRDQIGMARAEYRSAHELQTLVHPQGQAMLRAISRIYEGILDRIEKQGYDVLVERATVPKWRKMTIMLRSYFG